MTKALMTRKYFRYELWECVHAGMYGEHFPLGMSKLDAKHEYAAFLSDRARFSAAIDRVFREWPISCEQFLANNEINRVAWLGQAAVCIDVGIPCSARGGFYLMSALDQALANRLARDRIEEWLADYARMDDGSDEQACDGLPKQMGFPWIS